MPVWVVTGNMGGGKTVFAAKKAKERLEAGLPVATNIDLRPEAVLSPFRDQTNCKLLRLPDYPTVQDLDILGVGNPTTDESKNGLIVLDEAATMLNSRTYQDKSRQDLIAWFVHARKLGWDLIFVIQAVEALDKQIRVMLCEYKVTCRRMDRMKMPLVSWLGLRLPLPRVHFAHTRYGLHPQATVADFEFFRGSDVFEFFNTKQIIRTSTVQTEASDGVDRRLADRSPGVHSLLTPYHLKGRHMSKKEIYHVAGKKAFVVGCVAGVCFLFAGQWAWAKRPGTAPATAMVTASVVWSDGSFVVGEDGRVSIVDDKGKIYVSKVARIDSGGVAVYVNGEWRGVRRHG